ncbi:B3 domain-containing protein [Apostasia shenzhenica]|uniref:B3 domain-containing protein n=1 Tax=Apostasia shenzhenica TaxID=1088818 RepID=A0A2I0AZH0_9ASPA|nr:B3 domain-containing protein [Apostasia shenzhenica]
MEKECKHCRNWMEQCQRFEEHFYWDHVDLERMHFLKLMYGNFSNSMVIPKKFIYHFSGELLDAVELKVPSGDKWHVGLRKTNDGVALERGWKNFIEDHDIQENDTLLFKYDGISSFLVLMFDPSGCEKATAHCSKRRNPLFDFCGTPPGKPSQHRANRNFPRCMSQALSPSSDNGTLRARKNAEDQHVRVGSVSRKTPANKKLVDRSNNKETLNGQESMATEGAESQSDEVYSDIQFKSIDLIMSPKRIPLKFTEDYLPQTSKTAVLLLPEKTRLWPVQLIVQKFSFAFSAGWKGFSEDNNLKVGDICLFELLGIQDGITIAVHISHL